MLNAMTTGFIARLRANDQAAWFELWETFGPVLRAQLAKWGGGRIGPETVQDLSQETLAALSDCIDRYDPARGARFSTWLLAIAKHVLGDEMDRRGALKRGGARRAAPLDESWMIASAAPPADEAYERAVFAAKVEAALRLTEKQSDFTDFEIYRMRVLEGQSGRQVADALGISEPTVSRRLAKVRDALRLHLASVVATYSFTDDERNEAARNGLAPLPNKPLDGRPAPPGGSAGLASVPPDGPAADALFDDAVAEIVHRAQDARRGWASGA